MSWQGTEWASRQKVGSTSRKFILVLIGNRADEEGKCWPSQKRLAQDSEMSERAVRNHLKALESDGYIRRIARKDKGGHRTSDMIHLCLNRVEQNETAMDGMKPHETTQPADFSGRNPTGRFRQSQPADSAGKQNSEQNNIESKRARAEWFDEFWETYPRKRSKGQAEKAWKKIKPDEQLFRTIMDGLQRAMTSADWNRESGRFIPYPATWLNAKGWEDEYLPEADHGDKRRTSSQRGFANILDQYERSHGIKTAGSSVLGSHIN